MLRIWYEDINWINEIGQTIPMSYPCQIVSNARLVYTYKPPVVIEDEWNGKNYPVQIINNEGYSIQFAAKELSIHEIAKLQSCKKIVIHEFDTNEIIEVDTIQSGHLTIEPQNRNGSVEQSFIMTVVDKNKKTIINRGLNRDSTYKLEITNNSVKYTYYTDFEIINYLSDTEKTQYESNADGHNETTKTKSKSGSRMLFYLQETDMLLLKFHVENTSPSDVSINGITTPVEIGMCEVNQIGEGLYKCIVSFTTNSNVLFYA